MRQMLLATVALGGILAAAPAFAVPRCGFQGDWGCEDPP